MRTRSRSGASAVPLVVLSILVVAACAARSTRTSPRERTDRSVLTRELMVKNRFSTVYDAVAALRSTWLRPRGPESFLLPLEVLVYLDNSRLGTIETLRTLQPSLIASVRFYDGPTATSLWGVSHGAGVIHVSTWNNGAVGAPGTVMSDSAVRSDSASRHDDAERAGRPESTSP